MPTLVTRPSYTYFAWMCARRLLSRNIIKMTIEDRSIPNVHDIWNDVLERKKADHARKLAEITQEHEMDLKRLKKRMQLDLDAVKAMYESKLNALHAEYAAKFDTIKIGRL